jgi:PGF-CTERM protein/PGF-pre-PGF domain-containing protein
MSNRRRRRGPVLAISLVIAGLAFGFVAAPAAAQDQVVNQSSSSNADSIQEAIDNASSGDTIDVRAGTYNESVTVNKSLTLSGAGADSTTIVGAGEGARGESQPFAAIHVDDENGPVRRVTIEGFTVRNPDGTFGIFAGTGTTNRDSDGISGLVIRNNVVQDISTNASGGSLTGGPAGIGIRADYGTGGNPGIEITDNTISNVQADGSSNANGITLKSFTGEAGFGKDSGGNEATDPSSPPATDTDVVGNDISNIDAGDGSGRHIAKGISVSGEFEDVLVEGNDIAGLTAAGTGTNFARGITFTENGDSYSSNAYDVDGDGNGERIGPREFDIRNNDISHLSAGVFNSAIFVGGYEQFQSHAVNRNTISDGAVERVAGTRPGFQPGDGDALNASANTFEEERADLYYSDGSEAANLEAVVARNDFDSVDVIVGSTAITRPPTDNEVLNVDRQSSVGTIQNAVDSASAGNTIAVGSGTFDESVTIDTRNLTLIGPNVGLAGNSSDRIPEATITQGVRITADGVVLDGFDVTNDDVTGILLGPDAAPSDVTITNTVVRDVDGGTAGDKGVGNGINLQFTEEFEQTSSGVEITDNLITGVSTADASNGAAADAIGIQVLPRGNDVEDLRIANNVVEDIEPGTTTGRSEARAVSIATQFTNTSGGTRGDFGQATGLTIAGNEVSDLTADFARAFNLFEDERGPRSGPTSGERVGPVNFTITENSVDTVTSEDNGLPDLALFVGEYGEFGDAHSVQRNDFRDGVENFGGGSDTLNATENWWGDATGPAGDGPGDGPGFLRGDGGIEFRPFLGTVQADVRTVETVELTSSGEEATVESTETSVDEITIRNDTLTGEVTIQEFESPPNGTDSPSGAEVVTSVDIDVPDGAENDNATIRISINRSEFSADEGDLVLHRFDDTGGERERRRTDVVRSGDQSVTLEANTPGFSVFIVSQPVQEEQDPSASTDGGGGDDDRLDEEGLTDVRPGATGTTVAFPGQDLAEITFATEDASGSVTVEEFETLPSGAPPLDDERPVVGVFDISVPDGLVDTPATIVIELSVDRFDEAGVAPEEAVVLRGTDDGYDSLSTGIDIDDGVVVVTAETSGFSPFVVTDAQETATATATRTPGPTDDGPTPTDDEPTPTDDEPDEVDTVPPTGTEEQPGFGIAAAVAALVGAMGLLARRRDGNE